MGLRSILGRVRQAILQPRRAFAYLRHLLFARRFDWKEEGGLRSKVYGGYDDYVRHQRAKLSTLSGDAWLAEYDREYSRVLAERLAEVDVVRRGMTVLCLAARLGTEVKAFLNLGCFAVGIDLNPGSGSKYVLTGDFHDLQFPPGCVDVVFCNSLDHAFDLGRLLGQVQRVLKPGGVLVLEIVCGVDDGYKPGHYEALVWSSVDDLLKPIQAAGFQVAKRVPISYPWKGEHVVFSREAVSVPPVPAAGVPGASERG
ncbi:MAG: class I SAM-dependent methyltransferase [Planctomycetota bacterium]